jgi:hypothetical protein
LTKSFSCFLNCIFLSISYDIRTYTYVLFALDYYIIFLNLRLPTAQARKANDSATVEQIKQHFQRQIQEMLQSQQRHERQQMRLDPPPEFAANRPPLPWSAPTGSPDKAAAAATSAPNKMSMSSLPPPPPSSGALLKTNMPTKPALSIVSSSMQQQQTDIVNFSNMQRGKSFLEARSAVQRQIEKMFIEANEDGASSASGGGGKLSPGGIIKHTMHGVSHIAPEDEDKYCTPPPVHYGVQEALRSRRESTGGGGGGDRLSPPARTESKTEKFNSQRSTTVGGYHRGGGLDTSLAGSVVSSVGVAGAKTIVDLGNIDIMRRKSTTTAGGVTANHHRRSATEESLAAQVRLREHSREEQANIRRISVHQDSFDFTPTDDGEESSSGVHQLRSPLAASSPLLTTTTATGRLQQQPTTTAAAPAGARGAAGPKPPAKAKPVRYRIEYLGAVPLRTKASNLDALQV